MTTDLKPISRYKGGVGYKLSRASRILQNATEAAVKPYGISRFAWVVLTSIVVDKVENPTKLSQHIGIQRSTLSRLLANLEMQGFVKRLPCDGDQRENNIAATIMGEKLCSEITVLAIEAADLHLQNLSLDQRKQLGDLLELVSDEGKPVWY